MSTETENPFNPSWLEENKERRKLFESEAYFKPVAPIRQSEDFKKFLADRDEAVASCEAARISAMFHRHNPSERERFIRIVHRENLEIMRLDRILSELLLIDSAMYPEYPKVKISEEEMSRLLEEGMVTARKEIEYGKNNNIFL